MEDGTAINDHNNHHQPPLLGRRVETQAPLHEPIMGHERGGECTEGCPYHYNLPSVLSMSSSGIGR